MATQEQVTRASDSRFHTKLRSGDADGGGGGGKSKAVRQCSLQLSHMATNMDNAAVVMAMLADEALDGRLLID